MVSEILSIKAYGKSKVQRGFMSLIVNVFNKMLLLRALKTEKITKQIKSFLITEGLNTEGDSFHESVSNLFDITDCQVFRVQSTDVCHTHAYEGSHYFQGRLILISHTTELSHAGLN